MTPFRFRPKLVDCLAEGYSREQFLRDTGAGVTVGIVALPLAMAFAIASGVTPQAGLFTAIIAGFLISALGGSRVQIGGPTGAYIVIVYGMPSCALHAQPAGARSRRRIAVAGPDLGQRAHGRLDDHVTS